MTNTSKWKLTFTFGKAKPQETAAIVEQPVPAKPKNPHDPSGAGLLLATLFLLGGMLWWKRSDIIKFVRS